MIDLIDRKKSILAISFNLFTLIVGLSDKKHFSSLFKRDDFVDSFDHFQSHSLKLEYYDSTCALYIGTILLNLIFAFFDFYQI